MTSDEIIQLLLEFAALCEIKHHTPGSIVLKIGLTSLPGVLSLAGGDIRVFEEFRRIKGYKSHKVAMGFTGGTVSIDYDAAVFPATLWDELGRVKNHTESATLRERLAGLVTL